MRARPRLFICGAIGLAVLAVLMLDGLAHRGPPAGRLGRRGRALSRPGAAALRAVADVNHIRRRARLQDEGQFTILVLTAVAALASLGAIFALLGSTGGNARQPSRPVPRDHHHRDVVGVHAHDVRAALRARILRRERRQGRRHELPGENEEPDYWDFMYFSFVIGMCAQVSDVTVTCKPIRRTVFAHSVVSFIFNAALLALTVNIAASAI